MYNSSTMIKDSGERRQFETGAVRDITQGKGRCDLLPLDVVQGLIWNSSDSRTCSAFLMNISEFIYFGHVEDLYGAIDSFCNDRGWDIYTAILEVSIHYEQGASKYGERNWEHGIPLHSFLDSACRHYLKWRRGDEDEPHDRAVIWNLLGAIWTLEHRPELADIDRSVFSNISEE